MRHKDFRGRSLVSDLGFPVLESFLFLLGCMTALWGMHLMNPQKVHRRQL